MQQRLGAAKGLSVWNDLREQSDPSTPVTIASPFPYETGPTGVGPGNVALDPGSFTAAGPALRTEQHRLMSNALLISGKRSANGHPIFVAGPQVGYFSPEILMEEDLHGGGLDARGVAFPGLGFYLQIGRGPDYAWSATSASSDVTDQFAETLCGGDDLHYLFKGTCRAMEHVRRRHAEGARHDAGHGAHVPHDGARPGRRLRDVATGRRSRSRRSARRAAANCSARFRSRRSRPAAVHSPQQFFQTMAGFDLTFNWFYADSKHIAMYSSGRLPLRAPGVDPGLPTNGNGSYEWRGWLAPLAHPHVVDPASGEIVNWNNKPAAGFGAADDNWSYGSVHRVLLLDKGVAAKKTHTATSVVAAMNEAATTDLRWTLVPLLADVLSHGTAPSARDNQMLSLLGEWDGSRLDANGDGLDRRSRAPRSWTRGGRGSPSPTSQPVLGPLTDQLKTLAPIDNPANSGRQLVRRRLVLVRRQGPPHAARPCR